MKKKNRLQMWAALLVATLSMALTSPIAANASEEYNVDTTNRFLYAGEQYDETSGFYYLRARHYDVKAGRFTQEDTYLGDGRNLYAYVHSNPLKYVDPTGHNAQANADEKTNLLNDEKVYEGSKVSENTGANIASSKSTPNPYGKLGSPAHRDTVASIVISSQGKVTTEVKYSTPGGDKT